MKKTVTRVCTLNYILVKIKGECRCFYWKLVTINFFFYYNHIFSQLASFFKFRSQFLYSPPFIHWSSSFRFLVTTRIFNWAKNRHKYLTRTYLYVLNSKRMITIISLQSTLIKYLNQLNRSSTRRRYLKIWNIAYYKVFFFSIFVKI